MHKQACQLQELEVECRCFGKLGRWDSFLTVVAEDAASEDDGLTEAGERGQWA